jgi:hypothetical protein
MPALVDGFGSAAQGRGVASEGWKAGTRVAIVLIGARTVSRSCERRFRELRSVRVLVDSEALRTRGVYAQAPPIWLANRLLALSIAARPPRPRKTRRHPGRATDKEDRPVSPRSPHVPTESVALDWLTLEADLTVRPMSADRLDRCGKGDGDGS